MESQKRIEYLIDALKQYQTNFNSSAYQTMGFSLVAAGWLMTSKEARGFLQAEHRLAYISIGLLIAGFGGFSWLAWRVQRLSQSISDQLDKLPEARGLFEHYLLGRSSVLIYIAIEGLAMLFIILIVMAVVKP